MSLRFALHALGGLLLGLMLAAGVQLGFNILRFLVAPAWLSPDLESRLTALTGLLAAILVAGVLTLAVRRAMRNAAAGGLFLATAMAVLALALLALGLARPLLASGVPLRTYVPLAAAAVLVHAVLPRFALVPVLGGDYETAAMAPIHLLVFAKGAVLLVLATALALSRSRPVRERTA